MVETSVSIRPIIGEGCEVNRDYPDLHDHLETLESEGLLLRVETPINKDTELHPLVRWQYRGGLSDDERKAFLFDNVVDGKGHSYQMPVVVGALAGSRRIYEIGMRCRNQVEIEKLWRNALEKPVEPEVVKKGICQEVVYSEEQLKGEYRGLGLLPIPISTPGFDNAPYTTCSHFITKDPETGIRNMGNYRGQVKGSAKLGMYASDPGQHIYIHWTKWQKKNEHMPAAIVLGAPPVVSYTSVQKIPYGVDELSISGGLVGAPIRLVRCVTVPLEVPAEAEIIIEGYIHTDFVEPEGPFGESHGYMNPRHLSQLLQVTAITTRKDAILASWISQVAPSESSIIKKSGYELRFLNHLREACRIECVKRVEMHEPLTNLHKFIIIQMKSPSESDVTRALHAAASFQPGFGKIIVAVDDDIDPTNIDAVLWAMCYRMNPEKDVTVITGLEKGHAPPFDEINDQIKPLFYPRGSDSALLCNAILKEAFPPISLPKREYMERAREIWNELGLPPLNPESPWYGYSLGKWSEELDNEAQMAVQGEYYRTGEKLSRRRKYLEDERKDSTNDNRVTDGNGG